MKAKIKQKDFSYGINIVSRVVGAKTTLPVLGNILISIKKEQIIFSATDLEIAVSTTVAGVAEKEGQITIPARILSDFVLNNSDEEIEFEVKENTMQIKSEHYKANIKGIDAEEFPTIPALPKSIFAKISINSAVDVLKKVNIASANDETRPVLAGVYIKFDGKTIKFVATDSYRLAEKKIESDKEFETKEVVVPNRAMNEVLRLATSIADLKEIGIILEENQAFFILNKAYVVTRLIEGAFPAYEQIIPQSLKINIKANREETVAAIKMSSLFAKDVANNIKVKIGKDKLIITSISEQVGDTTSELKADTSGGELEIAFNARYLLDILNVISDEEIEIGFNDDSSPCVIRSKSDSNYLYLVMPLRTE